MCVRVCTYHISVRYVLRYFYIQNFVVVDAKKVKEDAKAKQDAAVVNLSKDDQMEVEGARVYDKKTLRDQYGNYPVWMSHRKILKHKKGRAKTKQPKTKTGKRLTRRQKKTTKQKQ